MTIDNPLLSIVQLPLDQVDPDPEQVRKQRDLAADALLLASINKQGQLVPVHVIPVGTRWKLIDGHGRYLALKRNGAGTIASIVFSDDFNSSELLIRSLVLNCCRSDIHYLDRAEAYRQLLKQHGWTQTKLAAETGEDLPTVNKLLTIGGLDTATKHTLRAEQVTFVKAYQLAKLNELDREGHLKAITTGLTPPKSASTVPTKRVVCPLASGITVTVSGPNLSMEDFLFSLEYVLKESRKHKAKKIDVGTLGKVFQDQAKQGGAS